MLEAGGPDQAVCAARREQYVRGLSTKGCSDDMMVVMSSSDSHEYGYPRYVGYVAYARVDYGCRYGSCDKPQ